MESERRKTHALISAEAVIARLKSIRDTGITDLVRNNDSLMTFLEEYFDTIALSDIKKEFLKRDLLELRDTTLDLVHYASLIKEIRESGNIDVVHSHPLLIAEIRRCVEKYGL